MKQRLLITLLILFSATAMQAGAKSMRLSDATSECLDCHTSVHPGIVGGWQNSRHATSTPNAAMAVDGPDRKFTGDLPQGQSADVVVGCAECHMLRPESHADTFEHNGYDIHVVVSPADCDICHADEVRQYGKNIMSHAYGNLADNTVYNMLEDSIIGHLEVGKSGISYSPADADTKAEACYYCHGTKLTVTGTELRDTELAGELEFPEISGWPNQGVGRINPDGSRGSCSACHPRHSFSMEVARKPHACSECHIGPDVPSYKVYNVSKHGNIFAAIGENWNYDAVPWTMGADFTAPTCAVCHISQVANTDGETVAARTHQMSDRLPWRIFGLVYAHPNVKNPDTTIIRNKTGLPLPTDFSGEFSGEHLIDATEMAKRKNTMQAVCAGCHDTSWVNAFWRRFENTVEQTNARTHAATQIMSDIWEKGYARGPGGQNGNPFDEAIERKWTDIWLIYANTVRFSSAMAGGGDYSVFADGNYRLMQSLTELHEWLEERKK